MMTNPFKRDKDRAYIWDMLVKRDILAFTSQDWSMIADDFIEVTFMGINGTLKKNPNHWKLDFPDLATYKKEWLRQAKEFNNTDWEGDPVAIIYQRTILEQIEVEGNRAMAHKKFKGNLVKKSGEKVPMDWQSLYYCHLEEGRWKIIGFTGYLPHPYGPENAPAAEQQKITLPPGANQHTTSGPYSPVLVVKPESLVVISGQAAIDMEGNTVGTTIEQQAAYTLDNCLMQLKTAGCDFTDVFKVNVYLKDIKDWDRFNKVYATYLDGRFPVRTAIQTGLIGTLLVEIELWACK